MPGVAPKKPDSSARARRAWPRAADWSSMERILRGLPGVGPEQRMFAESAENKTLSGNREVKTSFGGKTGRPDLVEIRGSASFLLRSVTVQILFRLVTVYHRRHSPPGETGAWRGCGAVCKPILVMGGAVVARS